MLRLYGGVSAPNRAISRTLLGLRKDDRCLWFSKLIFFTVSFAWIIVWFIAAIIHLHLQTAAIYSQQHLPCLDLLRGNLRAPNKIFLAAASNKKIITIRFKKWRYSNNYAAVENQCSWFWVKIFLFLIALSKMRKLTRMLDTARHC